MGHGNLKVFLVPPPGDEETYIRILRFVQKLGLRPGNWTIFWSLFPVQDWMGRVSTTTIVVAIHSGRPPGGGEWVQIN